VVALRRFETLADVVQLYNQAHALQLDATEQGQIVAFLTSL